jgi:hypothetical protein
MENKDNYMHWPRMENKHRLTRDHKSLFYSPIIVSGAWSRELFTHVGFYSPKARTSIKLPCPLCLAVIFVC